MRKIKFRGLESMTGDWVYGSHIQTGLGMNYIIPQTVIADSIPQFLVDRDTVCQYTGLKDKNGKEIYDGDILTDYGDEGPIYVEHSKEHAGFVFVDKFDSHGPTLYTPKEISYEFFEVIGNIYENPELLEETA